MSVIAACLPILGPVLFKNKRVDTSRPSKPGLSSYFRKATRSNAGRQPRGGKYSRAIDSIDRLQTQESSFTMKSLVGSDSVEYQKPDDITPIYVQQEFSVRAEDRLGDRHV